MTEELLKRMIDDCDGLIEVTEPNTFTHYNNYSEDEFKKQGRVLLANDEMSHTDWLDSWKNGRYVKDYFMWNGSTMPGTFDHNKYINLFEDCYKNHNYSWNNFPKLSELSEWHGTVKKNLSYYFGTPDLIVIKKGNEIIYAEYSIYRTQQKEIERLLSMDLTPSIIEEMVKHSREIDDNGVNHMDGLAETFGIYDWYDFEGDFLEDGDDEDEEKLIDPDTVWNKYTLEELYDMTISPGLLYINPKYNKNKPPYKEIRYYNVFFPRDGEGISIYKYNDELVTAFISID